MKCLKSVTFVTTFLTVHLSNLFSDMIIAPFLEQKINKTAA